MANNIDLVLDEVSEGISEAINGGFRTLGQAITEYLQNSGTQQASAVEVTVTHERGDGPTRVVVSDADPIFNEPIPEGAGVRIAKVNSADAGR